MADFRRLSLQIAFVQRDYPRGGIFGWSGAAYTWPDTFRLCDGTRLTPDLRDMFLPGAGDSYSPGDTGGAIQHKHALTSTGHNHNFVGGGNINPAIFANDVYSTTQLTSLTDLDGQVPPYHGLYLIMYDGRRY